MKIGIGKLQRKDRILTFIVLNCIFFFGFGVLFHDYAHTMWQVGGYWELLSLQGGYFGTAIMIVAFFLLDKILFEYLTED